MSVKITFIGAGSLGFTRTLIHDLLSVEVFRDAHFALHDIDSRNLSMVEKLILRDVGANNLPAVVTATRNRIEAVADADYVINTARVGGCEAFEKDIDIPLKYGVDQCVGDTLCAGGILAWKVARGIRTPSGIQPDGENPDRHPASFRVLLDGIKRPSFGIPRLVPKAPRGNRQMD